jgi:hypothetical protein
MPITAISGGTETTKVIGDVSTGLFPQPLHPNVETFLAQLSANSFNATRAQADALNNLVWSLVGIQIWSKMKIVYPMIGGTAATHKFNLVDPRDADAAFRLTFSGTWTHNSDGAKGDGTSAWADTYLVPGTSLTTTSGHMSYYSRIQGQEPDDIEMGCQNATTTITTLVIARSTTNLSSFRFGVSSATPNASPTLSGTSTQGLFLGVQNGSGVNDRNIYRNGVKGTTGLGAGTPTLPATAKLALNAINTNNTTRANFSSKQCAFASVGDGLTDLEVQNFYTIVQAYQTALGRQV